MSEQKDKERIAALLGIWVAAGKVKEQPDPYLGTPELDEYSAWLSELLSTRQSELRDEPMTMDEQEDEEQEAVDTMTDMAMVEIAPPAMAPEAWEARGDVICELVQMDELDTALGLIAKLDEFHMGNMLFIAGLELMSIDVPKASAFIRQPKFVQVVGWSRISEIWTKAYLANPRPVYLAEAMRACAACASREVPYGPAHPLMTLWKATGYPPALTAAQGIADTHPDPETQIRAHKIIADATGDPQQFISAFRKAEFVLEQGRRVSLVQTLITAVVNMCFRLNPEIAKSPHPPLGPTLSADQLKLVINNLTHDRWRESLLKHLRGCGIPIP